MPSKKSALTKIAADGKIIREGNCIIMHHGYIIPTLREGRELQLV